MDLQAVKQFLSENGQAPEVQEFLKGLNPVTLDRITDFVEKDEDGKKWLQSQRDSGFSKGIETWKANNLETLVMAKVKELYPEETEEQKRIRLLENQLEEVKKEKIRDELTNKAIKVATEKGLPLELIDYVIGENEESTLANIGKLESVFLPHIDAKVEERIKATGKKFQKSSGDGSITKEDFDKMGVVERSELYTKNPTLYKELVSSDEG